MGGLKELTSWMNRLYGIGYSYLLEKDKLIKNYTGLTMNEYESLSISDDYYMGGTCDSCSSGQDSTCSSSVDIREELIKSINGEHRGKIKELKEFAVIDNDHSNILLSFMPIIDISGEGFGHLISHSYVDGYDEIIETYRILFVFISFGLISIIFIFYGFYNTHSRTKEANSKLALKVQEKVKELNDKEQFFAQQSKMVTMGEMMTSILHQWKQPLSSISLLADLSIFDAEQAKTQSDILDNLRHIKEQTTFMSQTGGQDFANFLKPSKEKSVFCVVDSVEEVLRLFEFSFTRYNIGFDKVWSDKMKEDAKVSGYPNEFKHVLLNLFNNSRDAIVKLREECVERGGKTFPISSV